MSAAELETLLFAGLTDDQEAAVKFEKRRLLVVAGAGSGKTEIMARRIAWWVGVENISKNSIVAFTFTERAAEEMKFRIPDLDGTNHAGRRGSTLGLGTCRRENDYRD